MDRASAQSSNRDKELKERSVLDALERLIILKRQQYANEEAEYKLRSTQLAKYRQNQEDEFRTRLSSLQEDLDAREHKIVAREEFCTMTEEAQTKKAAQLDEGMRVVGTKLIQLDNWDVRLKESARAHREEDTRIAAMRDEVETYHEESKTAWEENKRILKTTREDIVSSKRRSEEITERAVRELAKLKMEREGFLQWKAGAEKRIVEKERELDIKLKTAEQLYGKNG